MTVRLTKDIRHSLCRDLIRHAFLHRAKALREDYARFARRVFDDVVPPGLQARIEELPSGWLPTGSQINVQFGSGTGVAHLHFNGEVYEQHLNFIHISGDRAEGVQRRMPYSATQGVAKVYEATHHLADEYEGLERRKRDLSAEIVEAKAQTIATLNSVSNVSALIKGWPEVEPFAAKYQPVGDRTLPALPVMALNKLLDLPVEEGAEAAESEEA